MTVFFPSIKRIGLLELLLAFYPILMLYQYGLLRFDVFVLIVMAIVALRRRKGALKETTFYMLCMFVLIHDFIWLFVADGGPSQINNYISVFLTFASIIIIVPAIEIDKLKDSFYLVALVVIGGLAYHLVQLTIGKTISPIRIPFFPNLGEESRFSEFYHDRPTSFFTEPGGAAAYLLVPLLFALREKRYVWSFVLGLFVLLTGSTNGVVLLVALFLVFFITQNNKLRYKITIVLVGAILGYFFMLNPIFDVGRNKISETTYETSSRLYNGPEIVMHMPFEDLILGMPFHTVDDYYVSGGLHGAVLIEDIRGTYFVSTIWKIIIRYGFIGLLFFLLFYISVFKKGRQIWPYLATVLIAMISSSSLFNGTWAFQSILLLSLGNAWKTKESCETTGSVGGVRMPITR